MNKNFEKYNTAKERIEAFNQFCIRHQCADCPLCHFHETVGCYSFCAVAWLDLEAEEEAMKCPCCGGDVTVGTTTRIRTGEHRQVWCRDDDRCDYRGPMKESLEEAISAHNRVCRAVMAAKRGSVNDY